MIRMKDLDEKSEMGKIIGTRQKVLARYAYHAQYGVAQLVQHQWSLGRIIGWARDAFGDAEAAVSHRLGYSNKQHMMLRYVRTCGVATRQKEG
jgi:hypothetical protein